jgi:hypothetical protein
MELPSKTLYKTRKRLSESSIRQRNLNWFNDFYFERNVPKTSYPEYSKSQFKFVVGRVYTFFYFDPKYKEELDFYNAVPVGIFVGYNKKSGHPMFLALQFIPPKIRVEILDKIAEYNLSSIIKASEIIRKSGFSERKLDTTYYDFKKYLQKSGFEFAIRSYILTRIQSRPMVITFWDWWRLCTFSGQFMRKKHIISIYNAYKKANQEKK